MSDITVNDGAPAPVVVVAAPAPAAELPAQSIVDEAVEKAVDLASEINRLHARLDESDRRIDLVAASLAATADLAANADITANVALEEATDEGEGDEADGDDGAEQEPPPAVETVEVDPESSGAKSKSSRWV
jgi:hypothetical protein